MSSGEESFSAEAHEEHYWLPIADLMTGLMILFLFVSITYMKKVTTATAQVKEVAIAWNAGKQQLYHSLDSAFVNDLPRWNAEIDSVSLSVRFKEPDVLFSVGSAEVRPAFRAILADFFPRYAAIIRSQGDVVEEIRIEGHTSTEGPTSNPYFFNMELSQNRTRAVLAFCLDGTQLTGENKSWLRDKLTANGLSSSKPVLKTDGSEDRSRSRRVEFRVRTNSETRIARILELSK